MLPGGGITINESRLLRALRSRNRRWYSRFTFRLRRNPPLYGKMSRNQLVPAHFDFRQLLSYAIEAGKNQAQACRQSFLPASYIGSFRLASPLLPISCGQLKPYLGPAKSQPGPCSVKILRIFCQAALGTDFSFIGTVNVDLLRPFGNFS